MAIRKYPPLILRNQSYEIAETRIPGERRIIEGKINIDRSVFAKNKREKEILKLAKLKAKMEALKR
jgi:hypothetical protein